MTLYRQRIYDRYVEATAAGVAPPTIDGLEPRRTNLTRLIADHFPADHDAAILDLGCGHGALLHFARQCGYRHVSGVDSSPSQVAAARRLNIDGVREAAIMPALQAQAAASLDAVIAFDVIEHLTKDELVAMTDEVVRVLKPGGRWIIHAPNGLSPFVGVILYGDLTHEQAFTPESLSQLFLSSGFRSAEFAEDPPAAHGLKSMIRALLWKLIRNVYRFVLAAETGATSHHVFTVNLIAVAVK